MTEDFVTCFFCDYQLDEDFLGLDVMMGEDGIDCADWVPCCEAAREAVECHGFEYVFGKSAEDVTSTITGTDVREVIDFDSILRRPLTDKAPGTGVKGWQAEVFADIDEFHSHHSRPQGWKFGVAVYNGRKKVGVAVVGRPVSRVLATKEPDTLEVTRVCVFGNSRLRRNAASKLYGICAAEAKKLGATKLITYTLESEEAASLRASNWAVAAKSGGGSWNRPGRGREDKAPTCAKLRWERGLDKRTRKAVEATALKEAA